jgi:outer membrane immunogenic protein
VPKIPSLSQKSGAPAEQLASNVLFTIFVHYQLYELTLGAQCMVGKPMKRFFVSALLFVVPSLAIAADVVASDPVPVIKADDTFAASPVNERWGGAYVGLSLGAGKLWDSLNARGFDAIGGGFAGYNWQSGNFVAGVEGAMELANVTFTDGSNVKSKEFYTARVRGGWANEKIFAYGSVGAQYSTSENFFGAKDTALQLGAGVDYALTDKVALGAEYTHAFYKSFGNKGVDVRTERFLTRLSYRFN